MSKRFTDTDKFKKVWFRKLSNDNKVFWMYLLDQCNHAGIWEVDFELAHFFCNGIDEQEIRQVFKKQYQEIDNGKRWFIKDFIDFQYGQLNENNRAHLSVINILTKYKIYKNKGLIRPLQGYKDKAKDKDMVKDKEKKADQIKKLFLEIPTLQKEFPNIDVDNEFIKWKDWMLANGKTYKNYKAAFKNWCRNDYVSEVKTTLKDIKTDITGFYRGKCKKCGKTESYDKSQIFQDSRCCKSEISPVRKLPDSEKKMPTMHNMESNDVLRSEVR
jgi:hypothetical protein